MQEIRLFDSEEFGSVRAMVDEDGAELFCGKDVAVALGYKNTNKAIKDHCKGVTKRYPLTDQRECVQEAVFITEPDVFRLIVRSKLPSAQRFEAWLFEEVLPALRRTGAYVAAPADETPEELMARALVAAKEAIARREERIEELRRSNNELRPKAVFADAVGDSGSLVLVRDMAKMLSQAGVETGGARLYERLRADGFIEKRRTVPTKRAIDMGAMRLVEHTVRKPDGEVKLSATPKITGKGLEYFMRRYAGRAIGQTALDI